MHLTFMEKVVTFVQSDHLYVDCRLCVSNYVYGGFWFMPIWMQESAIRINLGSNPVHSGGRL